MKISRRKRNIILSILLCVILVVWTVWGNTALMVNVVAISSSRISAAFSGFRIAQVSDLHNAEFGKNNAELLKLLSESGPVLLSHRPELFETYVDGGIDLALSGHAHGCQFRLPFIDGLVAPNQGLFPKYGAGLYTDGSTNMVVSRGISQLTAYREIFQEMMKKGVKMEQEIISLFLMEEGNEK